MVYLSHSLLVSIRSPDRSQGRLLRVTQLVIHLLVSIRSPDRSQGRLQTLAVCSDLDVFQSAPLTEARGDSAREVIPGRRILFQSAPLTEARGDDGPGNGLRRPYCFNPLP